MFESIETLANSPEENHGKIISIKKGNEFYFNLIATKVNDPENRNSGIIVALHNVTGLKELEKVKENFLSAISHEFKTPLTSIMMAVSMLREGNIGTLNADQADAVEAMQEESDRLLGLVNDLLELMRIESGKDVYHMEPCSINAIADASVRSFSEAARVKGVNLSAMMGSNLPEVIADFDKIRWVLNNLIGNALKHCAVGGAISISATHDSEYAYVSVQDTGVGIPAEYLDKIFDRFVQIESEDLEVRGTGLGLSTSKEIVQGHGGDIRVSSKVGQGSTFTFSLPIFTGKEDQ